MDDQAFPFGDYLDALVQLLDKIKYRDDNYERPERVKTCSMPTLRRRSTSPNRCNKRH